MQKYIGVKLIEAESMTHGEYSKEKYGESTNTAFSIQNKDSEGYKVVYQDGYVSWSPKEVFEKAYMQLENGDRITNDDVANFVRGMELTKLGEKTVVLHATFKNGFEIVESSSCQNPSDYDSEIGLEVCSRRVIDNTFSYLGFLLQCAKGGMK